MRLSNSLFASLIILLLTLSLQGCFPFIPNVYHTESYAGYSLPEEPVASLSNGLNIYRKYMFTCNCWTGEVCCAPRGQYLYAVQSNPIPKWEKSELEERLAFAESGHDVSDGGDRADRPLSAYQHTNFRMLFTTARSARIIQPATDNGHAEARAFDVWHNDRWCGGKNDDAELRFVVFNDTDLWAFVDNDPNCDHLTDNLFMPSDFVQIDEASQTDAWNRIKHRPMKLFYLNFAKRNEADFGEPRQVTRDQERAVRWKRTIVAVQEIAKPHGVYQMDNDVFSRHLPRPTQPDMVCFSSRTKLYMTIWGDTTDRDKGNIRKWCRPYSAALEKKLVEASGGEAAWKARKARQAEFDNRLEESTRRIVEANKALELKEGQTKLPLREAVEASSSAARPPSSYACQSTPLKGQPIMGQGAYGCSFQLYHPQSPQILAKTPYQLTICSPDKSTPCFRIEGITDAQGRSNFIKREHPITPDLVQFVEAVGSGEYGRSVRLRRPTDGNGIPGAYYELTGCQREFNGLTDEHGYTVLMNCDRPDILKVKFFADIQHKVVIQQWELGMDSPR